MTDWPSDFDADDGRQDMPETRPDRRCTRSRCQHSHVGRRSFVALADGCITEMQLAVPTAKVRGPATGQAADLIAGPIVEAFPGRMADVTARAYPRSSANGTAPRSLSARPCAVLEDRQRGLACHFSTMRHATMDPANGLRSGTGAAVYRSRFTVYSAQNPQPPCAFRNQPQDRVHDDG
jgi:hypothetical protein